MIKKLWNKLFGRSAASTSNTAAPAASRPGSAPTQSASGHDSTDGAAAPGGDGQRRRRRRGGRGRGRGPGSTGTGAPRPAHAGGAPAAREHEEVEAVERAAAASDA